MPLPHPLDLITHHFPNLTPLQQKQFAQLGTLYPHWNQRINVISKKDIDHLYLHHILHSLTIAKIFPLPPHTAVLDLGTGGGFPGIPLAIMFPQVHFTLIDSIQKKIRVVQTITETLQLQNVAALAIRAENLQGTYDWITTRAVARLSLIYQWSKKLLKKTGHPQRGWLCLKGGDLTQELAEVPLAHQIYPLPDYFSNPYFADKKLIHLTP